MTGKLKIRKIKYNSEGKENLSMTAISKISSAVSIYYVI